MYKAFEQLEDMQVGQKPGRISRTIFSQAYRRYQIHKKATEAAHGYRVSANHTQETESQFITSDAMQALECS